MTSANQLFRKTALERLSSPEQLDRLVVITDPLGWLLLTTLGLLLSFLLAWGIWGSIPYSVPGQGMLISEGGRIYNAMAPAGGTVSKINVSLNQAVSKGDLLILLDQPALEESTANARAYLVDKENEKVRMVRNHHKELELKLANFSKQKQTQQEIIRNALERKSYLEDILQKREEMLRSGLLSKQTVEDSRQQFNQVVREISVSNNRILELDARELDIRSRQLTEMTSLDQEIAIATRSADELASELRRAVEVIAPASGTISEIRVTEEAIVQPGAALISVASAGSDLQVILYVATSDGKKVKAGMKVKVAPLSVKKEEFGTLIGVVQQVSEFPVTREGMQSVLQNSALVQRFEMHGAPYAARVNLIKSMETPSGYRWTSGRGPNLQVSTGTTVVAEVTVREVSPISLVMPFLRMGIFSDAEV